MPTPRGIRPTRNDIGMDIPKNAEKVAAAAAHA
jgi:hypothetical protein